MSRRSGDQDEFSRQMIGSRRDASSLSPVGGVPGGTACRRIHIWLINLSLFLLAFPHYAAAEQASGRALQAVQVEVRGGEREVKLTGTVGQLIRIGLPKAVVGVHVAQGSNDKAFKVRILRAAAAADVKTVSKKDFKSVATLTVAAGGSGSHALSDAAVVNVSIPNGVNLPGFQDGNADAACTCCVTCSNGAIICGCRFQSSCGNCP